MKIKYILFVVIVLSFSINGFCDGLLLPTEEGYPKDLLKNRLTEVTVSINGLIAETEVYQEFVNEWYDTTDAVYSFPLPPNARATEFVYWFDDIAYKAILKVKEQAVNPGTGEGGVAAFVNKYIGRNGIKIRLKDIAPGAIQKVKLHYINLCDYYAGKFTYSFPLNTEDFITYPLEHLEFSINVNSNSEIIDYDIPTHPDYQLIKTEGNSMQLRMSKPKAYINNDFEFYYQVSHSQLGVDFYSNANDSSEGHFALCVRPQNQAVADSVLHKRILFLLSTSSSMQGYKLEQSMVAISNALNKLTENDQFNIVTFNNSVSTWKSSPVVATSNNIENARTFLDGLNTNWGNDLDTGIKECLNQIDNADYSNSIVIFSMEKTLIFPKEIAELNMYKSGIFPVGLGASPDRFRLEMLAQLNYGFVTYIDDNDNIGNMINQLMNQINQPMLKDVVMEYGSSNVSRLIPEKPPTTYAGSYFFSAGRYENEGPSILSIGGNSVNGMVSYDFNLDFNADGNGNKFAEYLWAKETIDALEREIEIYGETPALKDSLIDLSLKYNIRCRYTAYIADYETEYDLTDLNMDPIAALMPTSFIKINYPNPFNPSTTIRLYIDKQGEFQTKLLKIYNILGQLVAVIDISHLSSGWQEVQFNGHDMFGNLLPSGIYFVQLQVKNQVMSTIRISLIK
ncbi:MAG: VIT domain-containing protein [Calditrichaceae bacterium]